MEAADLVLFGGTVRTLDGQGAVAEAVVIRGERILAVGDSGAMRALAGDGARMIDLRGRVVIPGLIDSHNHLLSTGLNLDAVDLASARTVGDVLQALQARAGSLAAGEWVVSSSRWHETALQEQRFPTRNELDGVLPAHPALIRRGGHNVVANSLALRLAGIDETTPDPPGGTYVRRAGRLTGHIIGAPAYGRVAALLPQPDAARMVAAIRAASSASVAAGLTGVIEPGLDAGQLAAFARAEQEGALAVRAVLMQRINPGTTAADMERAAAVWERINLTPGASPARRGEMPGAGSGKVATLPLRVAPSPEREKETEEERQAGKRLSAPHQGPEAAGALARIGGVKIVADGGVETNYLREPYAFADDPAAPRGKPQVSLENLTAICRLAARDGRQLGVHCVGDAAIDLVLDAFTTAAAGRDLAPLRWTLIHMILARSEHLARARKLRLVIAAQQPLIYALGAGWVRYWGGERAARAMPLRAFVDSGLPVGGGSDAPVTPFSPLLGIWSSVTRATERAGVLGPEWGCTVEEALRMYTGGSAYLSFDEGQRGQIAAGFLADLTVLAADPVRVPVDELPGLPVEMTVVNGKVLYDRTAQTEIR